MNNDKLLKKLSQIILGKVVLNESLISND